MSISKKLWKSSSNLRTTYFAVAFCIVAISLVVANQGWGPSWLPVTLFLLAAIGRVLLPYWENQLVARDEGRTAIEQAIVTMDGNKGTAPKVAETTLADFGVHVALEDVQYITRHAETELLKALQAQQPVLLLGPSLAGKSRMGAEVLQANFPERDLIIPYAPEGLTTLLGADHVPEKSVIWLDDLERYISDPRYFKTQWLSKLKSRNNIVLATMRETAYETFHPTTEQAREQWELLNHFQKVRLQEDPEERQELAETFEPSSLRTGILRYGLGTYIGGGHIALERFQTGKTTHPLGVALLEAAVGWQLSGAGEAIPREVAKQIVHAYLTSDQVEDNLENFETAIEWATEWCAGAGSFRLLYSLHENLRPFDYLVDFLSRNKLVIPDALWEAVVNVPAPPNNRLRAGISALTYGKRNIAYALFHDAAEAGDARGMANLGLLHKQEGRTTTAEIWFERSAELGDEYGMNGLGLIYEEKGDEEAAERLYRQAGEQGYTTALNNLGKLLSSRGQKDEAEVLFKQAAELNNGWGMANWGLMLAGRGRKKEAEDLYRKAAALGNPAGMYEMGVLLAERGQFEEADKLYRKSAELNFPAGQHALGVSLADKGQEEEAIYFLQSAAKQNDPDAIRDLGVYCREQGDISEAERLFRKASGQGHPSAMNDLGVLLEQNRLISEAEHYYRRSAELHHSEAMHNLAALLIDQDRAFEAEEWLHRAVDAEFPPSMLSLAALEMKNDNLEEAERLYQHAFNLGVVSGLTGLAEIHYLRGDLDKAETALREAAAAGDAAAKYNLEIVLQQQGKFD